MCNERIIEMDMKQSMVAIILILLLCISGCRNISVGGTGKIGDVTGSGQVNIPIPKEDLETQEQ